MLWSQYILVTIRRTEFLRKEITRILNIANWNSNFLTLQISEFQKKNPTGIFGIKNGIGILFMMGVPEIGTKNWNSQPSRYGLGATMTVLAPAATTREYDWRYCLGGADYYVAGYLIILNK
jgi:hypothetical protein